MTDARADARHRGITIPPLTPHQQAMVETNTGLVGFVLQQHGTPPHEWDDAFQDGITGLMRATQKYDPQRGFTFATYATYWIRESVTRGRGTLQGRSYRSHTQGGPTRWHQPTSLDTSHEPDSPPIAHALPADTDPATQATQRALIVEAIQRARQLCGDHIDHDIVDSLGHVDAARTTIDQAIADRHGISREIVRRRRNRIQTALRHWAGGAVA